MFFDHIKFSEFHDKLLEEGLIAEALAFRVHHDGMGIGQFLYAGGMKLGLASFARNPVTHHGTQTCWNIPDEGAELSCHEQSIARLGRRMVRSGIRKRLVSAHELGVVFIAARTEKNSPFASESLRTVPPSPWNAGHPALLHHEPCDRRLRRTRPAFCYTLAERPARL